jgi:multicomponent Na+:H+ antiporter subunit A
VLILLAAFVVVPLGMPALVRLLGVRAFLVAAVLPLAAFAYTLAQGAEVMAGRIPEEAVSWIPALGIELSLRAATLNWVMALVVTGVGGLVLIYCRWYFSGAGEDLGRFCAVLLGFAGAMYGLVLTDDLVLLVMFWEITSVLSYLLIGHNHRRGASRRAALQALLVTTLGGLVMLIGVVLVVAAGGTSSIQEILADPPAGGVMDAALVLLLVGALSKSAIFPFHFWLPGAMAAPTPVSAYLHAAAMVKAGIFLIALLAPVFSDSPVWRPVVLTLGLFTMLMGGVQALREDDLKRLLAYGTVSQLGLLAVVLGFGTRDAALAGLALLVAHALFKSALFLVVGVLDRQLSTRDIRQLSGIGRQAPVLATVAFISVGSMIGIPPTLGFVAKEAALSALLAEGSPWGVVSVVGVVAGSVLTAAYGIRFVWGAFWTKRDAQGARRPALDWPDPPVGFLAAPIVLTVITLAGGPAAPVLDAAFTGYAETAPAVGPPAELALWHGLEPALGLSLLALALGAAVVALAHRFRLSERRRLLPFTAPDVYNLALRGLARLSVATTALTQRGSLPIYVGTVFVVMVAAEGTALVTGAPWETRVAAWQSPAQLAVAPVMVIAGIIAVLARKRYTGVVLVSATGLGMVVLFATSGAPDLALTQILVETVTLVVFALVLRRLPARLETRNGLVAPVGRAVLAIGSGLTMALVAVVAAGARVAEPISAEFPTLAYEIGHGANVVNVILVDLRGWDTMGELSVLVLAATGVASLVFVTDRIDTLSNPTAALPRLSRRPLVETAQGLAPQSEGVNGRRAWLVGGRRIRPRDRSILMEVLIRILFHTVIVVSVYLLFAGHNLPGGGFAAGLVAGMALVMRYLAAGRYELGAAVAADAGRFLGAGMILALACAVVPLLVGAPPLTSAYLEADLPVLGHVEFVTSTIFDVGVYLVVVGLVLDVLRSLGAEIDRRSARAGETGGSR